MKEHLILSIIVLWGATFAKRPAIMERLYEQEVQQLNESLTQVRNLVQDTTYDVQFYHLDIEVSVDTRYISGRVLYKVISQTDNLVSLKLDLESNFTVDSVTLDANNFLFSNKVLTVNLSRAVSKGEPITFEVYYRGEPLLANNTKGLRYETHSGNEPIIATLSTPFLSHTWWPCKDGPEDKADSVYIDITIPDRVVGGQPLIASSNGLLEGVETNGGNKKFMWRHRYPIVPYYVMMAISNYRTFTQNFVGPSESFDLIYNVFASNYNAAVSGMADMPKVMAYFSEIFGSYPFAKENLTMSQVGYFGGIENQTNIIIGNLTQGWFSIAVHEFAHMWFADLITCSDWHHGWVNEGFASYAEALWEEEDKGFDAYKEYMVDFEFYEGGSIFLQDVTDPFQVFKTIIYNKGAYFVHMLRGIVGDENFFRGLKSFATHPDFMYGHADTKDVQQVFEAESNMDLEYFFSEWIYDEYYPVYEYNFEQSNNGAAGIRILQTQEQENNWRPVFTMPVQIKITFSGGIDTLVTLFNNQKDQTFGFDFANTIQSIEFDPDSWILKRATLVPGLEVTPVHAKIEPSKNWSIHSINSQLVMNPPKEWANGSISLQDVTGKNIWKTNLESNKISIHSPALKPGIYLVFIKAGSETLIQKKLIY